MNHRPSWDEYFLGIATVVATRTPCLKRSVGAILVKDKRILTTGYNGPPSGISHCSRCKRLDVASGENLEECFAVHAEVNAIVQASKYGIPILGSKLYCTVKPCFSCAKIIINAGIKEVYYLEDYNSPSTEEIFKESEIILHYMKGKKDG